MRAGEPAGRLDRRSTRRASSSRRPGSTDEVARRSSLANMRNPDERRGDLRAQLAAHRLARAAPGGALRAATGATRSSRRWTSSTPTPSGACARRSAALPDGRYEASDSLEAPEGELVDPRGGHDRRRRDRDRLRRHGRAARGQPQLPARGHALGCVLRRPLPDRSRRARLGRRVRAGDGARARGLARQRAARPRPSWPGTSRPRAGSPTCSSARSARRSRCRRRGRGR